MSHHYLGLKFIVKGAAAVGLAALAFAACSSSSEAPHDGGAGGTSATVKMIGPSGGTVTANGVTLSIPSGALESTINVTIALSTVPDGYTALSAAYDFGPAGTTFAHPVTVTIPLTGTATDAHLYWSNDSGGYDDLGGTVNGMILTGQVVHFSRGFVAHRHALSGAGGAGGAIGAGGAAGSGAGGTAGATGDTGGSTGSGANTGAGGAENLGGPTSFTGTAPSGWDLSKMQAYLITSAGSYGVLFTDGTALCGDDGCPGVHRFMVTWSLPACVSAPPSANYSSVNQPSDDDYNFGLNPMYQWDASCGGNAPSDVGADYAAEADVSSATSTSISGVLTYRWTSSSGIVSFGGDFTAVPATVGDPPQCTTPQTYCTCQTGTAVAGSGGTTVPVCGAGGATGSGGVSGSGGGTAGSRGNGGTSAGGSSGTATGGSSSTAVGGSSSTAAGGSSSTAAGGSSGAAAGGSAGAAGGNGGNTAAGGTSGGGAGGTGGSGVPMGVRDHAPSDVTFGAATGLRQLMADAPSGRRRAVAHASGRSGFASDESRSA